MIWILFLLLFLYSVILHEISHGYVAYLLGDDTAYRQGRLSLNPIYHIDAFGSILLPLFLFLSHSPVIFGYARPVPVNPFRFYRIKNPRIGMALCSLAGPMTNLALGYLFCLMAKMSFTPGGREFFMGISVLNVVLGLFNLLPIPGLDGSHILMAFLPRSLVVLYVRLQPFSMLIILVLAVTGVIGAVLFPMVEVVIRWMC